MKKIAVELRLAPQILFFKVKEDIANALLSEFTDWQTNALSINLFSPEKKIGCFLEHNRIAILGEDVQNEHNFFELVKKIVNTYAEYNPIKEVLRIGVRFTVAEKISFKFDELVSEFQSKFYSSDKNIASILVPNYKDVAYIADFDKNSYRFHLLCGPVKKEEVYQRFNSRFDLDVKLFDDVMLFQDLDGYIENSKDSTKITDTLEEIRENIGEMTKEIFKMFAVK